MFHNSNFTCSAEGRPMVCFHKTSFCSVFNLLHVQYLLKSLYTYLDEILGNLWQDFT